MRKSVWNYLRLAGQASLTKKDNRTFYIGALAIRSDGAIVVSANSPCPARNRKVHAEYKVSRKTDVGTVIYVARVRSNGEFANARPCQACQKVMKSRGVKKVYYTCSNNEFGIMYF